MYVRHQFKFQYSILQLKIVFTRALRPLLTRARARSRPLPCGRLACSIRGAEAAALLAHDNHLRHLRSPLLRANDAAAAVAGRVYRVVESIEDLGPVAKGNVRSIVD